MTIKTPGTIKINKNSNELPRSKLRGINATHDVIPVETGIQTLSLRKQGTMRKQVPVSTGNPGFPIWSGMTDKGVDDQPRSKLRGIVSIKSKIVNQKF